MAEIKETNGGYSFPAVSILIINFLPEHKREFPVVVIGLGWGSLRAAGDVSTGQFSPFNLGKSSGSQA